MKDGLDIAFVFPNLVLGRLEFGFNYGTACLTAYLERAGFRASPLVLENPPTVERFVDRLERLKPKVVGITCYDSTLHLVRCLAKIVQETLPATLVFIGGATATASGKLVLESIPQVAVSVQGEGERSVSQLLGLVCGERWSSRELDRIRGITYRCETGAIRSTGRPELLPHLDEAPSPILSGVLPPAEAAGIGVMLNRGCRHRCIFCAFARMNYHTVRSYSASRVLAELDHLDKHYSSPDSTQIAFLDDHLMANKGEALKLLQEMARRKYRFSFSCQLRSDVVDRHDMELLRDAGFRGVAFGLESTNPRILRTLNKPRPPRRSDAEDDVSAQQEYVSGLLRNVALARELGMEPRVSTMIGLPGETRSDADRLLEVLASLDLGPGCVTVNPLHVACGTKLFRQRVRYGMVVRSIWRSRTQNLHETEMPGYVGDLPVFENSQLYLEARYQAVFLSKRIRACASLFADSAKSVDFVFVRGIREFLPVEGRLAMGTCVYVVGTARDQLAAASEELQKYVIEKAVPLTVFRSLLLDTGGTAGPQSLPERALTIGRVMGPLRVFQFFAADAESAGVGRADAFSKLDVILVVCDGVEDFQKVERLRRQGAADALLIASPFPLDSMNPQALTLKDLSISTWCS